MANYKNIMIKKIVFTSICLVMLIVSTVLYCKYDDVLWWRVLIAYAVYSFSTLLFLKEDLAFRISFMFRLKKYEKDNISDAWMLFVRIILIILMIIGSIYLIAYSGTLLKR